MKKFFICAGSIAQYRICKKNELVTKNGLWQNMLQLTLVFNAITKRFEAWQEITVGLDLGRDFLPFDPEY